MCVYINFVAHCVKGTSEKSNISNANNNNNNNKNINYAVNKISTKQISYKNKKKVRQPPSLSQSPSQSPSPSQSLTTTD